MSGCFQSMVSTSGGRTKMDENIWEINHLWVGKQKFIPLWSIVRF